MSEVQAIEQNVQECGKKVSESKKRFKWRFKVGGRSYLLQLTNSAVSGKRIVTLDSVQIYSEQSLLNINFDFMHKIDGHIFRITRVPDNINKFELRIDNRAFSDILNKSSYSSQIANFSKNSYKKTQTDPFSEFGSFASTNKVESKSNDFGDFDFDNFSKPSPQVAPSVLKQKPTENNFKDPFANDFKKGVNSYETVNFQTNNFQTNNFGNFAQNFSKVEKAGFDEECFATNTYGKNNFYNQLIKSKPSQASDVWTQFPSTVEKPGTFKIEFTGKQVLNKVLQTVEQIKSKITQNESLI